MIKLAGYNVDKSFLKHLPAEHASHATPETFSAAYARISRSSLPVDRLRAQARKDVAQARQSNQNIIFGMGHHSVAEHSVFNFDVLDISRLALEALEHTRLASFTEKSQRYVTLEGGFHIPSDLDAGLIPKFSEQVRSLFALYQELTRDLLTHDLAGRSLEDLPRNERLQLECAAKEDARYVLPLATTGQVGMTVNGRTLEAMLRRLSLSPHAEVRALGTELHELVMPLAPSIILFPQPSPFETLWRTGAGEALSLPPSRDGHRDTAPDLVVLDHNGMGDRDNLAALMAEHTPFSFDQLRRFCRELPEPELRDRFLELFSSMQFHDATPRAFELPTLTFQARISAACYGQLKRHRMATLIAGPYDAALPPVIPPRLEALGRKTCIQDALERSAALGRLCNERSSGTGEYLYCNAHVRPVLMQANLREIYHLVRLRSDEHAQWDIRNLSLMLEEAVRGLFPLASLMLCGKSDFDRRRDSLFPKHFITTS